MRLGPALAGGTRITTHDVLFKVAHKLDPLHLVPVETSAENGIGKLRLPEESWRGIAKGSS